MAPFIGRPEGFSDESLELLDKAMTEMWMRQVAIGAAMSGHEGSAATGASRSAPKPGQSRLRSNTLNCIRQVR